MTIAAFVPTAEAAFIAGLSDREMNRVMDEHIVPDTLFRLDNGRRFARLAAAFARFYFGTEGQFVATLRRQILEELTRRVEQRGDKNLVFAMVRMPKDVDWCVTLPYARIDVSTFIQDAVDRVRQVEQADALVHVDPELMDGLPVFAGTRVPVEAIMSSLDKGIGKARLVSSYPFLTDEHIAAARTYVRVHPKRGRPRRLSEANPSWAVKSSHKVRAAKA